MINTAFDPSTVETLRPLHDHIIVSDMVFKERFSAAGILIPSDDKTMQGVRPRWGKVYAVGPKQSEITVGQWVLVAHGRWTRGHDIIDGNGIKHTIRRVDNDDIMAVSDTEIIDETMGRPL